MLKDLHEFDQADAERLSPAPKFNHVDTANSPLALADYGLMLSDASSEFGLGHTRSNTGGLELLEKGGVLARVKGF
jgi:hypothetical protein